MRERDKWREGEVGLDHLEVGKRSRDEWRQREIEGERYGEWAEGWK